MQYPLISEYVRAIQDASNNLDELAHLVPVQDDHGEPYRSSGAFAVVFKMQDEQTGKCYALKCFTEEQEGRAEAYRQIADELASLMNKGFEVTEAKWLFGVPAYKIEVLIHPQSVVHSAVQFVDGAVKAQLGVPDMVLS